MPLFCVFPPFFTSFSYFFASLSSLCAIPCFLVSFLFYLVLFLLNCLILHPSVDRNPESRPSPPPSMPTPIWTAAPSRPTPPMWVLLSVKLFLLFLKKSLVLCALCDFVVCDCAFCCFQMSDSIFNQKRRPTNRFAPVLTRFRGVFEKNAKHIQRYSCIVHSGVNKLGIMIILSKFNKKKC